MCPVRRRQLRDVRQRPAQLAGAGRDTASSARCSTRARVTSRKASRAARWSPDATAETKSSLAPFPSFRALRPREGNETRGSERPICLERPSHCVDLLRIVIMCARYAVFRCETARGCEDNAFLPALVLAPGPGGTRLSSCTERDREAGVTRLRPRRTQSLLRPM